MAVDAEASATDVALRDGSTVRIRPAHPEDRARVAAFLRSLSETSRHFRFFSGAVDLERAAEEAVSDDDNCALVATRGFDREVVAHALYVPFEPRRAEVAFAVADALQGHGLGTLLLTRLAEIAAARDIAFFEAEVLPENHRMVDVFRKSGFDVGVRSEPGVVIVDFPTALTPEARSRYEERDRVATAAALRGFLQPESVAVIGASRERGTPGGDIFHNLLAGGFNGPVFPVNRGSDTVQSVHAYRSISDVPGTVDLAVIVVPAEAVLAVARECAERRVRSLVVISAGFSESGHDGQERQRRLLELCRTSGMRLVGPNCLGILNTAPDVRLNASVAPGFPPPGRVGFMSQSGALGIAVVTQAEALEIGISSFVSAGNKADISGNDLLRYWAGDDDTDVILLYLESFGNPRAFARIAPEVARAKPVLAVKSGRSQAGAKAAGSHTGALLASSDVTVDALFRQAGVIRADGLSDLFDVARLMSAQPVPQGRRVVVVTNAGGPAILAADACVASGLELPSLPATVGDELRRFLPAAAAVANPVDMLATASPDDYRRTLELVLDSGTADAVIAIYAPPMSGLPTAVSEAIHDIAATHRDAALVSVLMAADGHSVRRDDVHVPTYAYPEQAAAALGHAVRYGAWRSRDRGSPPQFDDLRTDEAAALIGAALGTGDGWLAPPDALRLLECYGIPVSDWRVAASARAAGAAARELGGPTALKGVASNLLHKSDAGAVKLDLAGLAQVEREARAMNRRLSDADYEPRGFLVQRMSEPGVEMLVGVVHDELFGPVLACGAGGTAAEVLGDVEVRLTPLTERDAAEMVRSLRTYPLLTGFRGAQPADVAALERILLRLSALVEQHHEVGEIDLNPVVVRPDGAIAVDARIRVQAPPARRPFASVD